MPRERLLLCNINPARVQTIAEMIQQLSKIKGMNCNAVWLNPFMAVGTKQKVVRVFIDGAKFDDEKQLEKTVRPANEIIKTRLLRDTFGQRHWVTGSLYAATYEPIEGGYRLLQTLHPNIQTDDIVKINQQWFEDFKQFTQSARDKGITPLFDLVMNHVSLESPLYDQYPHWFTGVNTVFNDVYAFNYENAAVCEEIFLKLWRPYIDWMIDALGFRGVRVDCIGLTSPFILRKAIFYINKKLKEMYEIAEPVIFGELLGNPQIVYSAMTQIKGIPFSHIMSQYHFIPAPSVDFLDDGFFVKQEKFQKEEVFVKRAGGEYKLVGAIGTHDALPLLRQCQLDFYQKNRRAPNNIELELLAREKIAMVALGSNGGWFFMLGDERGEMNVQTPPFILKSQSPTEMPENTPSTESIEGDVRLIPRFEALRSGDFNFEPYISQINSQLANIRQVSPFVRFAVSSATENRCLIVHGKFMQREGQQIYSALKLELNNGKLSLVEQSCFTDDAYSSRFFNASESFLKADNQEVSQQKVERTMSSR